MDNTNEKIAAASTLDAQGMITLVEWLRPRLGGKWLVLGQVAPETVEALLQSANPASVTIVVADDETAARVQGSIKDSKVTVVVDDFTALRKVNSGMDAALALGVLQPSANSAKIVNAIARVTRLYGIVAAVSQWERRAMWDLFLDARLNDVLTRSLDSDTTWMVRGTR